MSETCWKQQKTKEQEGKIQGMVIGTHIDTLLLSTVNNSMFWWETAHSLGTPEVHMKPVNSPVVGSTVPLEVVPVDADVTVVALPAAVVVTVPLPVVMVTAVVPAVVTLCVDVKVWAVVIVTDDWLLVVTLVVGCVLVVMVVFASANEQSTHVNRFT